MPPTAALAPPPPAAAPARPVDAETAWGGCCVTDAAAGARAAEIRFPWFRFLVGLFVAGQTMLLGIAINLTPPEDATTRVLLQGGMLAATLLVLGMLGVPLLVDALRALRRLRPTMELLFLICVLGSFALSLQSMVLGSGPVYFDVVAVLLIVYSIGRAISASSRRRALASMHALADQLSRVRVVDPDAPDGERWAEVCDVAPGWRVRVRAGELVPVDGRVVEGEAFVRETAFTGEWLAARRGPGDAVIAATACEDAPLVVEATAPGSRRRVDELGRLIERARAAPTSLQRQADRFVAWFLPFVMVAALATGLVWGARDGAQAGLFHALAVLLVACPCAAGLATPLVFWTLLGRLARHGLVLRGGDAIERLATADSVLFDKTGTLGDEKLAVERFDAVGGRPERLAVLAVTRAVERESAHPIAAALRDLPVERGEPDVAVRSMRLLPGRGVAARVAVADGPGREVVIERDPDASGDGRLHLRVVLDGAVAARIVIRERLRGTAERAVAGLRDLGLEVRILTGDAEAGAAGVRHLAPTRARLSPEDKHALVARWRTGGAGCRRPVFVGDGLNDAAAMAAAHTGVAIASGSAVAVEAAGATLHGGDLTLLPRAIGLARTGVRAIRSNLAWAVLYNFAGIAAAATGHLHPVLAALLMAASSALVSWRSFRLGGRDLPLPEAAPASRARAPRPLRPDEVRPSPRTLGLFEALHGVGLVGQVAVLGAVAALSTPALAGALGLAVAAFLVLRRTWRRLPAWADMTLGMVTLGGLGMNLGWWADLGFAPAALDGAACPLCAAAAGGDTGALLGWMNGGMLLLGVPAMYLLRHTWRRFSWRHWCCSGMLVLGVPGMVFGMLAGSVLASRLAEAWAWTGSAPVVLDYALMMAGMVAGMLVPHLLEVALPRRLRA